MLITVITYNMENVNSTILKKKSPKKMNLEKNLVLKETNVNSSNKEPANSITPNKLKKKNEKIDFHISIILNFLL